MYAPRHRHQSAWFCPHCRRRYAYSQSRHVRRDQAREHLLDCQGHRGSL